MVNIWVKSVISEPDVSVHDDHTEHCLYLQDPIDNQKSLRVLLFRILKLL